MFKTLLAVLTVLVVVAISNLFKLLLLPFRALRDRFRDGAQAAR